MVDSSAKLLSKLATLNNSLDELEEKLEPLLAQTLPESLLSLDTIQQAKLNVALPYLVYDMIFIYLRTRGIDPKSHPVIAELDRVRQYYDKIQSAEDPEKRKTAVDKAAANRFIKHAIAQVKDQEQRTPGEIQSSGRSSGGLPLHTHIRFDENGNANASSSGSAAPLLGAQLPPGKVTRKMVDRAEYHKQLAERRSSTDEEDALEFIDDEVENNGDDFAQPSSKGKGKGDGMTPADRAGAKNRRRPAPDPFAGYGDSPETKSTSSSKKQKKTHAQPTPGENMTETGSPPLQTTKSSKTVTKNAKKKAKKT